MEISNSFSCLANGKSQKFVLWDIDYISAVPLKMVVSFDVLYGRKNKGIIFWEETTGEQTWP